jgi:hypothetical protein
VDPEIRPEPTQEERAAILAALERLLAGDGAPAYRSAWREAGIRENLDESDAENYEGGRGSAKPS